jgi:predicted  nucleic acid-binding Zn-ribbon protein
MKKENCPFCGHRWIRKSSESMIECPNCRTEYFIQPRDEETQDEEIVEEEDTITDEFEERNP